MSETVRLRGRVKNYKAKGRFGFVTVEVPGEEKPAEYYFHIDSFQDKAGAARSVLVEFTPVTVADPGRCDRAVDIVVVG